MSDSIWYPLHSQAVSFSVVFTFALLAGFGIGVLFGVFTASIDPMSTYSTATDKAPSTREYLREARIRSGSYGRNFAVVGMMFAGTECMVETVGYQSLTFLSISRLHCYSEAVGSATCFSSVVA